MTSDDVDDILARLLESRDTLFDNSTNMMTTFCDCNSSSAHCRHLASVYNVTLVEHCNHHQQKQQRLTQVRT